MTYTRRIRPRFSSCTEALEPRTMMDGAGSSAYVAPAVTSKTDIGVNVGPIPTWMPYAPFVDITKALGRWGQMTSPWTANPSLKLNADAYPLSDAAASGDLTYLPDGVYKLSWAGNASVKVIGYGSLKVTMLSAPSLGTDGRMHVSVQFTRTNTTDSLYAIQVTGINPASPMRDLKMIRPGYDENTTQVYTDDFLKQLQPFKTLRFIGWVGWGNTDVKWSDRASPNRPMWTGDGGAPYEAMIDLANTVNSNIWLNIPTNADDDYVRNLAQLIKTRLEPGLTAYIEYSNELWNYGGPSYAPHMANAKANTALTPGVDTFTLNAQQNAFEIHRVVGIFRGVFGSQYANVIRPVLGGFAANPSYSAAALSFYGKNYGSPAADGLSLGIAPYMTPAPADNTATATEDQLFASMSSYLETGIASQIAAGATLAKQYDISMVAYEAGQHLVPLSTATGVNTANHNVKTAMQSDPRMAQLYERYYEIWTQYGGKVNNYLNAIYPNSIYGYWGLLTHINSSTPGSQKWDAVMRQMLPAGDATLDYRVDYADFLVLKANFNGTSKVWEQGDFNGDNKVNQADLNLLRTDIDTGRLTSAQLAEVFAFGVPAPLPGQTPTTPTPAPAPALPPIPAGVPTAFDFGTPTSPTPTLLWKGVSQNTIYSDALGYGWTSGVWNLNSVDRGTVSPLTRDFVQGTDATFAVRVANGTYSVSLGTGDIGSIARDNLDVYFSGVKVGTLATAAGTVASANYTVVVTNGYLTLRLVDTGGATPQFALAYLRYTLTAAAPATVATTASTPSTSTLSLATAATPTTAAKAPATLAVRASTTTSGQATAAVANTGLLVDTALADLDKWSVVTIAGKSTPITAGLIATN